ncbi:MAG: hypothetical protein M1813_008212 [Trichoglossum hirsutum]|nr:MAG: hypothetical protein M1813_008212 [Trichoglossum hirsutum]
MESPDDIEACDMDLTASMGFGAFGTQPHSRNKKRRYNHNEAIGSNPAGGSNALPLGPRKEVTHSQGNRDEDGEQAPSSPLHAFNHIPALQPPATNHAVLGTNRPIPEPWKETSSRDDGKDDLAYYCPSFVENPWRELERILKERDSNLKCDGKEQR